MLTVFNKDGHHITSNAPVKEVRQTFVNLIKGVGASATDKRAAQDFPNSGPLDELLKFEKDGRCSSLQGYFGLDVFLFC